MKSNHLIFCLLLSVTLLTVTGCRPRGVLSSSKMREVMYDLHRTEAVLQQFGYNYGHDEAVAKYYYVVLEKHGVTQAQFDSSLVWYTAHPDFGNKLYPKVLTRMEEDIRVLECAIEERDHAPAEDDVDSETTSTATMAVVPNPDDIMAEYRTGLWPKFWYFYPLEEVNVPFCPKNDEKE